jgi:prepilin-type N-terminal cleavage/methylation domain-containing protein
MRTRRPTTTTGARTGVRLGFTLVELTISVAIILIGTAIIVPAFGRIFSSVSYSSGVNQVTATIATARAEAIRTGRHTAVAFYWDPVEQRMSMEILTLNAVAGSALSQFPAINANGGNIAVSYRPLENRVPVELPPGVGVFGLSFAVEPTDALIDDDTPHWYAGHFSIDPDTGEREPAWLFPRNSPSWYVNVDFGQARFRDQYRGRDLEPWLDPQLAGAPAQRRFARAANTFCIQFSPEGRVVNAPSGGATPTINAYLEIPRGPFDLAQVGLDPDEDLEAYDSDLLFDPERFVDVRENNSNADPDRNPEVVMRSAVQLAIVDLDQMQDDLGYTQPWHVTSPDAAFEFPRWAVRDGYFDAQRMQRVNQWIDRNGEIVSFNRYSGQAIRVSQGSR